MILPKPKREDRIKPRRSLQRTQMKRGTVAISKIGKVGRARLDVVRELNEQWSDEPFYNTCEIWQLLRERGHISGPQYICLRPITWAHARKHRSKDALLDSPYSHYTACRACSFHHMSILDTLHPDETERIVMAAIAGRELS